MWANWFAGRSPLFSGRRQPSCDGTSRMMREYPVRICEGLGVKFPGPTRQKAKYSLRADVFRCSPDIRHLDEPIELAFMRGDGADRETCSGDGRRSEFTSKPYHVACGLV